MIAGEISPASSISVKEIDTGTIHACAATDQTACEYQTYDLATEQMSVATVTLQSATEL